MPDRPVPDTWAPPVSLHRTPHRRERPDTRAPHGCHRPVPSPRCRAAGLAIGVGADQAGVDRKPFATYQPLGHASRDRRFEQRAQQVAIAEAPVAVLREGRVVGHVAVQPQPAEPAIGQVQMHLVAQPALGPDAHAIADDEHPDHQFRIDRGATRLAVEGLQLLADARQVHEPVDRAQQVICRHMPLQAEAVEQRLLRYRPLAHHRPVSAHLAKIESDQQHYCKTAFFNTIHPTADIRVSQKPRAMRHSKLST